MRNIGTGNYIDPTAKIEDNIAIGNYNYIGKNVIISGFKEKAEKVLIGDCNFIYDNTRILIGEEGASIGDWNVLHNDILVMGNKKLEIGHNCWIGQNTIIDSSGGLKIGNGVRIGMYSQIWTHVGSGELIEGCTLIGERKTILEDEVWLVGSCTVASGLRLRYRSICLIGSNLTKDTEPLKVYGGNPAKLLDKLNFWKEIALEEKFKMMNQWVKEYHFNHNNTKYRLYENSIIELRHEHSTECLLFGVEEKESFEDENITYFNLGRKTYTKRLTSLEREFYRFIFDHKARFIPVK